LQNNRLFQHTRTAGFVFCLAFALSIQGALPVSASTPFPGPLSNTGLIWGRITDMAGVGLARGKVTVRGESIEEEVTIAADDSGWYAVAGLRPGSYTVEAEAAGFSRLARRSVAVEPFGRVRLEFELETAGTFSGISRLHEEALFAARTFIPAIQIERLLTGNSLNSLVENQDVIATSNRIDVGGMGEALPSLFGSRGAASWTQNTFLYDGLDITEPFSGGTPLVIPDIFALDSYYLSSAAAPIQALTPGAYLDLSPREGGSKFHGGLWGYYLDKSFGSSNITPALQAEDLAEADALNRLMDIDLHLSGPLGRSGWTYFTSWSNFSVARDLADYEPLDESRLTSGTVHLVRSGARRRLHLFWTGQLVSHPSFGAGRNIPFESTVDRSETRNLLQVISESRPGGRTSSRYGASFALAGWEERLQDGASGVQALSLFRKIPSGTAAAETDNSRIRLSAFFDGRTMATGAARPGHLFEYGAQIQYAGAGTEETIPGNGRLHYANSLPIEVLVFQSPFEYRQQAAHLDAYLQDTMTFGNGLSLSFGLHAVGSAGWSNGGKIRRVNFSPRFALQVPFSRIRTSTLRITAARYYATFPLSWLAWGDASAPGALAYVWADANSDGLFSEDERGTLLRKEGPRYGAIDEDLRLPSTDELTISWNRDLGRSWIMSLAGFLRETRGQAETVNIGVPASAYTPRTIFDIGDDQIPDSIDDLVFTVYDQRAETLGRDLYLLTNPADGRKSTYAGLDFVLFKRPTDKFLFFLAMTATQAVQLNGPGNTALENDDGVLGPLYDNPNAAINAEGRPRFDRAYTIRIGLARDLPFETRVGLVARYYDGQPFARMIVVEGLTQGPVMIQAHPRGVARYEFNMTVDFRLEKYFRASFGTIRLMADVFNLFNQNLATAESEWTRPEFPLRYATDIQSPRTFRLGVNVEF